MADEQANPPEFFQGVEKQIACGCIQMIGRLVQCQQIRLPVESCRDLKTFPLSFAQCLPAEQIFLLQIEIGFKDE